MFTVTTALANTTDITFTPVMVTRGRKYRGFAYSIGGMTVSQPAWNVTCYTSRLWDPQTKKFVYANTNFLEDVTDHTKHDQLLVDKAAYLTDQLNNTIEWCKSQKTDNDEAMRFARNIFRKRNPEMLKIFDELVYVKDTRDVAAEIDKLLNWAMGLKTRACWMYGKFCPGGKDLPDSKKLSIARKSAETKGLTKLAMFEECWNLALTIHGLSKYIKA